MLRGWEVRPLDYLALGAGRGKEPQCENRLCVTPVQALLNLRADADVASDCLPFSWPSPNRTAPYDEGHAIWIGPNELLILDEEKTGAELKSLVDEVLEGLFFSSTDLSSAYERLALEGPDSRQILAKLVPLDFHKEGWVVEQSAATLLGRTGAIITCRKADRFEILIGRSFARYGFSLLRDAGLEQVQADVRRF